MAKRILLANEFGNNIFTRNTISSFMDKVENLKDKSIVLDFKGIAFISRSCADEYVKMKKQSKKKIVEEHISKNVLAMFDVVRTQYKSFQVSFPSDSTLIPA